MSIEILPGPPTSLFLVIWQTQKYANAQTETMQEPRRGYLNGFKFCIYNLNSQLSKREAKEKMAPALYTPMSILVTQLYILKSENILS